jgi:hypothetical protein
MTFLPTSDLEYLKHSGWKFEEKEGQNLRALIIFAYPLPPGKFEVESSDILIQIPVGYPDTHLDMFWCSPILRLRPDGRLANQTQTSADYFSRTWQRWSRHYEPGQWKPGISDLSWHMNMVETALLEAR